MLRYKLPDFNIPVQYMQATAGTGRNLLPGHNVLLLQQISENLLHVLPHRIKSLIKAQNSFGPAVRIV